MAVAAAHCQAEAAYPRDMLEPAHMVSLQRDFLRLGQFIPNVVLHDPDDMAQTAHISASSVLALSELPPDGEYLPLEYSWARMLPVNPGRLPHFTFFADATAPTTLTVELRTSNRSSTYTPDVILGSREISLIPGRAELELNFNLTMDETRYVFLVFQKNPHVRLRTSKQRLTGLLSVANKYNKAVANSSRQEPPAGLDIGIESFEFWTPQRRPQGHNLALRIEPALNVFAGENVVNGIARPTNAPNA